MKIWMRGSLSMVASVLVAVSLNATAQQHDQSYDRVVKVQAGQDNYLYINVQGNFTDNHGCQNKAFARSRQRLSDERTEAISRIAIASLLSGNPVHVFTRGCVGPGTQGYPILDNLQVYIRGGS